MVIEHEIPPFGEWFSGALWHWIDVVLGVGLLALFLSYVVLAVRHGPIVALGNMGRALSAALGDLFAISPRRVAALSWLAIKESIHRLVLVAFGVFLVILLFAGWFIDPSNINVLELYLSFVMTTTSYLVLLLALFLSVFSLPNDVAKRTLHTIVTKPVRSSEVVLGRMLGFALVGTAVLAITGVCSYFFVVRGLRHVHEVEVAAFDEVEPENDQENPIVKRGLTSKTQDHEHEVFLYENGQGRVEPVRGHTHQLLVEEGADGKRYSLGPPIIPARVPVYGKLSFKDRQGRPSQRGINVGDEWSYRQYVEGGTAGAAIWNFDNIYKEDYPNGLNVELTVQVFRTYKGNIEKPVMGTLVVRNPDTDLASEDLYFSSKEFHDATRFIPRKLLDRDGNPIDLFDDLVHNGRLQIEMSTVDPGQFLGAAQADLYIRGADASFAMNVFKGYLGIWEQMLLVIGFGVMFSTFLNGAVAMLATFAVIIAGNFTDFITDLSQGRLIGGGPSESFIRLITQRNQTSELEASLGRDVAKLSDALFSYILRGVSAALPDFKSLSDVSYVAKGYDIPWSSLMMHTITALAYVVPAFIAGYFLFKGREVAK